MLFRGLFKPRIFRRNTCSLLPKVTVSHGVKQSRMLCSTPIYRSTTDPSSTSSSTPSLCQTETYNHDIMLEVKTLKAKVKRLQCENLILRTELEQADSDDLEECKFREMKNPEKAATDKKISDDVIKTIWGMEQEFEQLEAAHYHWSMCSDNDIHDQIAASITGRFTKRQDAARDLDRVVKWIIGRFPYNAAILKKSIDDK